MTRDEVLEVIIECVSQIENEADVLISLGDIGKYPTIGELTVIVKENM